MRSLVLVAFWLFFAAIGFSFAGALHGAGDSLAVFRHWWGVGLLLCSLGLLIWRAQSLAVFGATISLAAIATVFLAYQGGDDGAGRYSIYQKNMLYHANSPKRIIRDIRALQPDFITLQEVLGENRDMYFNLSRDMAAANLCKFSVVGDVAVLSRWPLVEGSQHCLGNLGAAAMQVATPDGPVWVIAVHLHWPFPHGQAAQVDLLAKEMEFLDGPVVLAGDFNMVPWSHTVARLETASGTKRAGPAIGTYDLIGPSVVLPIDHVLVPSGRGTLESRPLLGSDHLGLLLRFDLPVRATANQSSRAGSNG